MLQIFVFMVFWKREECFLEEVSKCAKGGCRQALNTIFNHEQDKEKKRYLAELGAKNGFDTYIYELIDYYEDHDQFKFWRFI